MVATLEAVKNGSPVQRAANEHGVYRYTLQDKVSSCVSPLTKISIRWLKGKERRTA